MKYRDGEYGWRRVTVGKTRFVWEGFGQGCYWVAGSLLHNPVFRACGCLAQIIVFDRFCVVFW